MHNVFKRKARTLFHYKTPLGQIYTKAYDIRHHLKFSFKEKSLKNDPSHLKYYLTKHYHIIEKGLALPEPRLGFGQPKILDVVEKAKMYQKINGNDQLILSIRKTLSEYMKFNEINNYELPVEFKTKVDYFLNQFNEEGIGGLKFINKESSSTLSLEEFGDFLRGRVSVRNFSNEPVREGLLHSIIDIAKNTPSVCNRQGWKAHSYSDKSEIRSILSYQNGNKGFTDIVDKLVIITADAKAFTSYESNQVFIDGGLFSMNVLLALHAAGLGACPLNTCLPSFLEQKVKKLANIHASERLIMMIAVGSLKNSYSVAYSARNNTNDIHVSH